MYGSICKLVPLGYHKINNIINNTYLIIYDYYTEMNDNLSKKLNH